MSHRLRFLPLAALAALSAPAAALARQPIMLNSDVYVERISTDLNGRERRVLASAPQVGPGDRLVFVLRYRNGGSAPVNDFAVTNPVPAGVRIDPTDRDMLVSVDGGQRWGKLDSLWVRTPLGGTRRATAEDITHIRWTIRSTIGPGDGGRIAYRGIVR